MARDEREEQHDGDQVPAGQPKGALLKWIIMGVIVLVIVGAGVAGGIFFFTGKSEVKKPQAQQQRPLVGAMWAMDPFIVNLLENNGDRYLKAVLQLELSDPTVVPELEQLKPKLRDNILDLLSAKSYRDLMEMGGKDRLREEIAMRLNSFLTRGKIVKVYFTDFVIQ